MRRFHLGCRRKELKRLYNIIAYLTRICIQCQTTRHITVVPSSPPYSPAYLKANGMANNPNPSEPLIICIVASCLLLKLKTYYILCLDKYTVHMYPLRSGQRNAASIERVKMIWRCCANNTPSRYYTISTWIIIIYASNAQLLGRHILRLTKMQWLVVVFAITMCHNAIRNKNNAVDIFNKVPKYISRYVWKLSMTFYK